MVKGGRAPQNYKLSITRLKILEMTPHTPKSSCYILFSDSKCITIRPSSDVELQYAKLTANYVEQ